MSKNNFPFQILIVLIFTQIIMGAFVSGLDAGKIYQTWPLMGSTYIPDDLNFINTKNLVDFNSHSLVQFYHRCIAYIIILYVFFISLFVYRRKLTNLYQPLKILIIFLIFQVILGIYTLISGLNIYLASAHQITGVLLVFSALNLYFFRAK